jgi:DNA-directed RNA polymerase specialized sigma24 family protein
MSMKPSFIEGIMENIRPQIISLAIRHELDVDDLLQDTAVRLLTVEDKLASLPNACAYAVGISRHIAQEYRTQASHHSPVNATSLDAPLFDDECYCLGDTIVTPLDERNTSAEDLHADVVHKALRRLPLEEQQFLCEVHQINAFHPCGSIKHNHDIHDRHQRKVVRQNAYRHLRKDADLAIAVEKMYSLQQ